MYFTKKKDIKLLLHIKISYKVYYFAFFDASTLHYITHFIICQYRLV